MSNIFMRATRDKLRFTSPIGDLSVEQLWDLPLTSLNKSRTVSLDLIARHVSRTLRELGDESFVEKAHNPEKDVLNLRLDILKAIIAEKISARDRAENVRKNAERKQRLLAVLEAKENSALHEMSEEDIRKAIEAIDSPK